MHEELVLRLEVEALLVEWAARIDEGRASSAAELFCEDAEQTVLGTKTTGLPAIREALLRRERMSQRLSRHIVANFRIVSRADDLVAATWLLTLYRSDTDDKPAKPHLVATVQDQLRRGADGRWQIWRRELSADFGSP